MDRSWPDEDAGLSRRSLSMAQFSDGASRADPPHDPPQAIRDGISFGRSLPKPPFLALRRFTVLVTHPTLRLAGFPGSAADGAVLGAHASSHPHTELSMDKLRIYAIPIVGVLILLAYWLVVRPMIADENGDTKAQTKK